MSAVEEQLKILQQENARLTQELKVANALNVSLQNHIEELQARQAYEGVTISAPVTQPFENSLGSNFNKSNIVQDIKNGTGLWQNIEPIQQQPLVHLDNMPPRFASGKATYSIYRFVRFIWERIKGVAFSLYILGKELIR